MALPVTIGGKWHYLRTRPAAAGNGTTCDAAHAGGKGNGPTCDSWEMALPATQGNGTTCDPALSVTEVQSSLFGVHSREA